MASSNVQIIVAFPNQKSVILLMTAVIIATNWGSKFFLSDFQ